MHEGRILGLCIRPCYSLLCCLRLRAPEGKQNWASLLHLDEKDWVSWVPILSCCQGNECRKLLKNTHKLLEILPSEHYKFYNAFVTLNSVVDSCFGVNLLPGYQKCLKDFEQAYMEKGLNVTPKAHLLFVHATEDIEKHGHGLGLFNGAAAE